MADGYPPFFYVYFLWIFKCNGERGKDADALEETEVIWTIFDMGFVQHLSGERKATAKVYELLDK